MCKHGFAIVAKCALCNPVKGRVYVRMATGAKANKGKRHVTRTKKTRPPPWTRDARISNIAQLDTSNGNTQTAHSR